MILKSLKRSFGLHEVFLGEAASANQDTGAICPAQGRWPNSGSHLWSRPNYSQICFVPRADAQLDRCLVARNRTGSGCPSKMGVWEGGFLTDAAGGLAAGTKAEFGLSSCHCAECDF